MEIKDTYRTISKASEEVLFKDRKSKFFGYAFPIESEEAVKDHIDRLRKQHPTANHVCYAWQIGTSTISYRANDDGEPNNSAGMPIYGQIQSFQLTNILVAIVRIFGGTKLGVGGLINAYRNAAKMVLESSTTVERILKEHFFIKFDYDQMNTVMRFIKKYDLILHSQDLGLHCEMEIAVRKRDLEHIKESLNALHKVKVSFRK
ncbi:IMPACT family protein [Maribacter sp. 2304DJ31-5]|uniref:IMPACT family protein n=1 Tax=Maribacter sp. 2304DJ31-5 TaxID=3386273 RepID=UPI0039BD5552